MPEQSIYREGKCRYVMLCCCLSLCVADGLAAPFSLPIAAELFHLLQDTHLQYINSAALHNFNPGSSLTPRQGGVERCKDNGIY